MKNSNEESFFYTEEEQKLRETRTKLMLNGSLKPHKKSINKSTKKKRRK